MTWVQGYDPMGNIILSAIVAGIPLYILLFLLGVKKTPGHFAAAAAVVSALVVAVAAWGMPAGLAINSVFCGAAFGLFPIVWIVVTAIWVYNMTVESGEFEIIKNSLASITEDRRLQALFVAFAFGSFIEGTAGFGTPVAITAAMLVGLGFNPVYAAGICLIANTAPVAFGGIGIPVIVAAQVSGLDIMHISQIIGRQLPFLSIIVPLWVAVTMSGWKRSMEVLPALLVGGGCFAVTQWYTANYVSPYLPDITSAVVTIVGLGVFLRFWKPSNIWRFPDEKDTGAGKEELRYSSGEVVRAWMPYILLAIMVFLWGWGPVKSVLGSTNINIPWPGLHNAISKAVPIVAKTTPYGAVYTFGWLSAGGSAILLSGILSLFVIPNYGVGKAIACFGRTIRMLMFPIVTIAMILGLAYLMNYSGMSATMGLAFTKTGSLFPLFAPILGWLGVFLTGSDTSSNALFSSLQRTTAEQIGADPYLMVAANSSGGVCGKMLSPQSISVATAATGLVGQEGTIFRFTLPHSIAMIIIVALMTYSQAYFLHWMLPPLP
ncbi:lactate permease LctP family transporter [uncultured Anaeromusa sp.]|uniref:L-lactate permease n=1 Tax=uncultured Anaeromusa sp. TaxID=673273 RepID=UPI0029C7D10F|nr:lactate permease LctP family transporter [uncultured Anaeromusa sp.]